MEPDTSATDELGDAYSTQQAANAALFGRLQARGVPIDPGALLDIRSTLMLDLLMPEGGVFRAFYEQMFEQRVGAWLADIEKQADTAKLIVP